MLKQAPSDDTGDEVTLGTCHFCHQNKKKDDKFGTSPLSSHNGEEQTVPVTQVAGLRNGKNSGGKWYTADEKITMYDIMGNTHSVAAKDIETSIAHNKWSTQPIMGPFKEPEYNKIWKKNLQNTATIMDLMGKTQYKPVKVDGKTYFEALPPDVEIEGLGESTPFYVDMMQEVYDGRMSYSELFNLCKLIGVASNEYIDYKTDNFHFVRKGNYIIVEGAHTDSALKRGIIYRKYRITDTSPHTNVMQYVKIKPALKEAFLSKSGKAFLALDIAVGAGFDIWEAVENGKRGEELAIEIVEELGSNAAISIISTAAGAALTAKIGAAMGTVILPGVGTVIGTIAGMFIGDVLGRVYERYFEDDAVELITSIFDLFGI